MLDTGVVTCLALNLAVIMDNESRYTGGHEACPLKGEV